jgi:hypothetical protein
VRSQTAVQQPASAPAAAGPQRPRERPAPAGGSVPDPAQPAYDSGYQAAVSAGYLSVQQAVERGERHAAATRLAQRHRLPLKLALQVADNRITIKQALDLKAELERRAIQQPQTSASQGVLRFVVLGMGALILAGVGLHLLLQWFEGPDRDGSSQGVAVAAVRSSRPPIQIQATAPPPPPLTVPKTDSTGQVIEVVGPDPKSVLVSFCVTGTRADRREAVTVVDAVPPSLSVRLGIFRNLDRPDAPLRAIRIREDPTTNRWVAGDGRNPVPTEAAPAASN